MKKIFSMVIVAPILALFGGIGVLAYNIARSWDNRNTDVLISGVITACSISGMVIALVLSAFVALVFYSRWQKERDWMPPPPKVLPPANRTPSWDAPPPLQVEDKKGHLYSKGSAGYEDLSGDVFGDTIALSDEEWRYEQ